MVLQGCPRRSSGCPQRTLAGCDRIDEELRWKHMKTSLEAIKSENRCHAKSRSYRCRECPRSVRLQPLGISLALWIRVQISSECFEFGVPIGTRVSKKARLHNVFVAFQGRWRRRCPSCESTSFFFWMGRCNAQDALWANLVTFPRDQLVQTFLYVIWWYGRWSISSINRILQLLLAQSTDHPMGHSHRIKSQPVEKAVWGANSNKFVYGLLCSSRGSSQLNTFGINKVKSENWYPWSAARASYSNIVFLHRIFLNHKSKCFLITR